MDSLLRWREPAAIVLLVVLAVRLVLGLVAVPVYAAERYRLFSVAAMAEGSLAADPLLVVAAALTAIWCTRPEPTRHARSVLTLAFVGCWLLLLVSLVYAAVGLASPVAPAWLDFLTVITALTVPLLAAIAVGIVRFGPAASTAQQPTVESVPAAAELLPAAEPDPQNQPGWRSDQASGAAWSTAGEAATGAPASDWGADDSGWNPIPHTDPSPRPPTDPGR